MPSHFSLYGRRLVLCFAVATTIATAGYSQVPASDNPVNKPVRDTVVIYRRDTIVVIQRDTSRPTPSRSDQEQSPASTRDARLRTSMELEERRRELREQRRREYEEWYDSQPDRRAMDADVWGYKFYPSALMSIDFPSALFAVERTYKGSFGLQGALGILTEPTLGWSLDGSPEYGTARFGLRGLDFQIESRIYMSNPKSGIPFYLGANFQHAIAPLNMDFWVNDANGIFEQYVAAPVNASQTGVGFLTGWEFRTPSGAIVDMATGLRVGVRRLRSENETIQDALIARHWNLENDGRTPYINLVMRVGFGYGSWLPLENAPKLKKNSSKKKRSRKGKRR